MKVSSVFIEVKFLLKQYEHHSPIWVNPLSSFPTIITFLLFLKANKTLFTVWTSESFLKQKGKFSVKDSIFLKIQNLIILISIFLFYPV